MRLDNVQNTMIQLIQMDNPTQELRSLPERVTGFEKELQELQRKYNLSYEVVEDFPIYRKLPEEVALSILVLRRHGLVYKFSYRERTPNNADKA